MSIAKQDFNTFISNFEVRLRSLFREENDINKLSLERGLPAHILKEIMAMQPLSVAVAEQYGGRGAQVKECLGILSAASYESLPLSLTFGINIALFLEPLLKYGHESAKERIFKNFISKSEMGGLMITEPDYGSDALNMKTASKLHADGYHVKGVKHWQGLTGMANHWLIASRNENADGQLGRDIDFFLCDIAAPNQQIIVEEYFDNAGLYMIPYGRNIIDIIVPADQKLIPHSTGIKMMLDILHRSRMQFPGMAMGFVKRMLDEAIDHCSNRKVGNSNLLAMDNVKYQISRIQHAYTICSAMCARSSEISSVSNDLAAQGIEANTIKAVVTDLMQESAHTLVQLSGANGFKISHIGGRGIMDSRPFQIFEGSNEMLYAQLSEAVLKMMKKVKQLNLFEFLKDFELSSLAAPYFKELLSFTISEQVEQRSAVVLGKIISRVICASYVLSLGAKGYRTELVDNSIKSTMQELSALISNFKCDNNTNVVSEYEDGSTWLNFV
ncbi:MAG: acyl-CoA dehydrogenase [Pedobacter sp.]|nr:MAG: acyl-CoA dehydrogenase [Pedobacter sp.]